MDKDKEIGKLKERVAVLEAHDAEKEKRLASLEAQLGKTAQSAAVPGGSLNITYQCGHKEVVGSMATPGSDAEAAAIAKLEARDCPKCETVAEQKRRIAEGKAEFEGRPVDDMAMVTRR